VADKEYYRYFARVKMTAAFDEHYFHTLLYRKDPEGMAPWMPMATRWKQGPHLRLDSPHPIRFEFSDTTPGFDY